MPQLDDPRDGGARLADLAAFIAAHAARAKVPLAPTRAAEIAAAALPHLDRLETLRASLDVEAAPDFIGALLDMGETHGDQE